MKKFYVITNRQKDPSLRTASYIRDYLEKRGCRCLVQEESEDSGYQKYKYTDPGRVPEDVDCVLVLGGDGTVLRAARDLVEREIPLFGINLGTLGYLAEIGADQTEEALEKLMLEKYVLEKRMMLKGQVFQAGKMVLEDAALNDIVISRSGRLRVMDFHIYVNGRLLNTYSADGIIVSTPTGSTGYNLSAGGPIVSPAASMILLTPIAPHTLTARSVILPEDVTVKVEIGHRSTGSEGAEATFDGDTTVTMGYGDFIEIQRSESTVRFAKIDQISFLEILRKKMSGT